MGGGGGGVVDSDWLQRSYLCVFKGVHDEDGEAQSKDVGQEAGVEVRPAVLLQAAVWMKPD